MTKRAGARHVVATRFAWAALTCLLACVCASTAYAASPLSLGEGTDDAVAYPEKRSVEEIRKFVFSHDFDIGAKAVYSKQPVVPTEAGSVSSSTQTQAVNALNSFRYVAGVPADVTSDAEYAKLTQAASLVSAANGTIDHFPKKPDGVSDSVYDLGKSGSSQSNLAMGFENPAQTVFGYMEDSDSSNIADVGHRRWCLNPLMRKTAFGFVDGFSAMYAFDGLWGSVDGYVAWPAQHMPTAFFDAGHAWSLSVPEDVLSNSAQVVLTRVSDGKVWNFTPGKKDSEGECYLSLGLYGGMPAIIFRPGGVDRYRSGDAFRVQVTDASTKAAYSYTVDFFDLVEVDGVKVAKNSYPENTDVADKGKVSFTYGDYASGFEAKAFSNLKLSSGMQGLFDGELEYGAYSWSSMNPKVASFGNQKATASGGYVQIAPGNAGTSTVTVSYYGKKTTFTVEVEPAQISDGSISGVTDKTYTGSALSQKPVLNVSGKTLKEGTDYTVSYKNNVKIGTASVTLTGKGNYTGTKTATFAIVKPAATWKRLWGVSNFVDQFDTMQAVAREGWKSGSGGTVILATGENFPDALSASGVAGLTGSPILLTNRASLPFATIAELKRIKPNRVIIAGGYRAVLRGVDVSVKAACGVSPKRIYGQEAPDTAAALNKQLFGKKSKTAIVATSVDFYDALSAAPVAYAKHYPVFLADNMNTISKATLDAMVACGIKEAILVGGEKALSKNVERALASRGIKKADRLWGNDYYDTSRAIANWAVNNGMSADKVGVATSYSYYDALTGAALCGKNNAVLLLADEKYSYGKKNVDNGSFSFTKAHTRDIFQGYIFGGWRAVSEATLSACKNSTK